MGLVDLEPIQCRATSKSTGKRCTKDAIPGGVVCRYHGGEAPQVKRAAERRLCLLAAPVLDTWARAMKDDDVPWATKVQVGKDILDRLGVGADERSAATGKTTVSLTQVNATLAPDLDQVIAQALARSAAQAAAYLDRQAEAAQRLVHAEDAVLVEDPSGQPAQGTGDPGAAGAAVRPALPAAGEQGASPATP